MSTVEKMSVHKALAELKIIDSRIERSIDDAQFCVANKHSNEKINGIPVEDAKKLMVGSYDKASDLIKRRNAIKRAVVLSNAKTIVMIADREYTVAEAIEMKNHGIDFEEFLLNEMRCKWFKKVSQTMMFLPYFISQVLVGFLVFNLLNYDTGFVNEILTRLGMEKWGPYSDPHVWPVLLVIIYLWQQTGYNSVVYFASICGIDAEMIEASKVDGANAFQRIRYILLPSLKPTVIILLLFALGGIVKGNFGLFYNIIGTNSLLYDTTDIIETFVYRATMTDFNFSTASAVGLYQSVVGFVIVMIVNYVVKKIEPDYSLF